MREGYARQSRGATCRQRYRRFEFRELPPFQIRPDPRDAFRGKEFEKPA